MPRPRNVLLALLGGLATLFMVAGTTGSIFAAFSATTQSAGNEFRSAADWSAPSASSSVVQKSTGGSAGYIRQGASYRVFANVADGGSPPSGIDSVTGDVSVFDFLQTATPLTFGGYTADGQSFNYRSGLLTANSLLSAGTYGYSLAQSDTGGNSRTQSGFSVVVDNTTPSASDVQTTNALTLGKPDPDDSVILTFSEPVDPNSILAGWAGDQTDVVVRINDNASSSLDSVTVYNAANTTLLPLGTIRLGRNDYVNANRTFGATGTTSKMTLSGSTLTLILGRASGATQTTAANSAMTWLPATGLTDRAGNAMSTTTRTESGTSDKDF